MLDLLLIASLVCGIVFWCLICAYWFKVIDCGISPVEAYQVLRKRIRGTSTVQYMPDMEDMIEDFYHSYHNEMYYQALLYEVNKRRRELQGEKILESIN